MGIETKFEDVIRTERNGRIEVVHDIDQLVWYNEGIRRVAEKYGSGLNLSAVRFNLPYRTSVKQQASCLFVVGNGANVAEVYFFRIGKQHVMSNKPSGLWNLFSFNYAKPAESKDGWEEKPKSKVNLRNVFTTEINPFLREKGYREDELRSYNFKLNSVNDNRIKVIADTRRNGWEQKLKVVFMKDRQEKQVITLKPGREFAWNSDDLEGKISTANFSF